VVQVVQSASAAPRDTFAASMLRETPEHDRCLMQRQGSDEMWPDVGKITVKAFLQPPHLMFHSLHTFVYLFRVLNSACPVLTDLWATGKCIESWRPAYRYHLCHLRIKHLHHPDNPGKLGHDDN